MCGHRQRGNLHPWNPPAATTTASSSGDGSPTVSDPPSQAWIFRILANTAKTQAERESRTMPLSALPSGDADDDEPSVDPSRFFDQQHARWPGHWASPPARWDELPEEHLSGRETLDSLKTAIEQLPSKQRQVIVLRDIEGWDADDVCQLLELSEANQRVLLHRARSKVRQALEEQLG